jgi:magnesium-transporting ATPase (P-type)
MSCILAQSGARLDDGANDLLMLQKAGHGIASVEEGAP